MVRDGLIEFFARHPVAGNLLMIGMLLFGVYGIAKLSRQVLPDFTLDVITITAQWPGASPEDVEANIVQAIEPEVRFLENVETVQSYANEGRAKVTLTFEERTDMSRALTDVQAAVARITTFPSDMERPVISWINQTDEVCRIEVTGPFPEESLKRVAKRVRDGLLDRGMASVSMAGMREREIWVEIPADTLRELDLSISDVAARISQSSLDLPAGSVESGGISRQIRSEQLARTAPEVAEIELLARPSGEQLRLRDVGRVYETFEENAAAHSVAGNPSIGLIVSRARGIDSIEAQRTVTAYLEELRAELPPTLRVEMYDVFADQATQRVRMLMTNGLTGLMLVLVVLGIFLNGRVAFWVAMGIPVSILAALGTMAMLGLSLNLISMFALVMGLGIVVDDSIVVGEHTEMLHRHGLPPEEAIATAARRMAGPVTAAWLTTAAAFFPILTIGSTVGLIIRELPITIIIVLTASVIECLFVLPMHLKHALVRLDRAPKRPPSRFRLAFNHFRDTQVRNAVAACFRRRYSTVLGTFCLLIVAVALLPSGRVGFEFFASPETDIVFGNFAFAPGSPRDKSAAMVAELARSARAVEARLAGVPGSLIRYGVGTIGRNEDRGGFAAPTLTGDHLGAYTIELVSGDLRKVRNPEFIRAWEEELRLMPGVERISIIELSAGGPPGRDLDVRLSGAPLEVIKQAAIALQARLKEIPGVMTVEDNLPFGKQEMVMAVTPAGRAIGFTTEDVARQVRNAFEGAIAKRFSMEQEEIIVRVKLSPEGQVEDSLRGLYLRAPDGSEVPLTEVAVLEPRLGFAEIRREDGLRQVSIGADIDLTIATTNEVAALVARDIVPDIRREFGINVEFKGKAKEQREALGDTGIALLLALSAIYIILAWVFASYTTPLVVMSVIPLGLVGAIVGHWVMGFNLNMLSLQALLGLAGVLVNDSIVLVSTIRNLRADGMDFAGAVVSGARERFRPVLLTSSTTIVGLMPLLFERSLQAQLIQPLAVTLIFGLLTSPFLVLFFVPSLLGIGEDLRRRLGGAPATDALPAR